MSTHSHETFGYQPKHSHGWRQVADHGYQPKHAKPQPDELTVTVYTGHGIGHTYRDDVPLLPVAGPQAGWQ